MSGLIHSNRVEILCVGFIVIVYVTGIPLYYNFSKVLSRE